MNVKRAVENQIDIFNMLKHNKERNRLSHAYLFYGNEGCGKVEMAYALACLLYCPNGGCLECETCKTILDSSHLNVNYIGLLNKKTMISKEQIEDLQEEFSKTSLVEGTRIYIVDGIDVASLAAQNSLLKFIEDPVNKTPTVGIFIANELSNVVSTIKSRCIVEYFKDIPLDIRINNLINDGYDKLDSILGSILTNNVDESKAIIDDSMFIELKNAFLEFIKLDKNKDMVLFNLKYTNMFRNSSNLNIFLKWLLQFIDDSISENLILEPLCDRIKMYSKKGKIELRRLLSLILELFNKLKANVNSSNVFFELTSNFIIQ